MNVTPMNLSLDNESFLSGNESDSTIAAHRYSVVQIVIITIVASCLSLVTVIGNSMVMISFKIDKQLQTISNYFLFSLAVADFAIGLFSMPLFTISTVLGYWPLGPLVCDTWLALDYLASNASVLNLLIISFDRYFSVTRPLTYRARRTTVKAAIMIASAWGVSAVLWPPWIYAWPYIEGKRTVPDDACYIQFIETNHYITFGTAIAAFYVPVTVMCILYWRIWRETEKRQKDLPNLQAGKQDASKRSNSSDEALDMDDCKRPRSESSTGADEINSSHIAASYMDSHYPQYKSKHRPLTWTWLKMSCIAWWHSGREDEDEDEDVGGPESSRTGHGCEETLTPLSAETPLTATVSRCASLSVIQSTGLALEKVTPNSVEHQDYRTANNRAGELSSDSVGDTKCIDNREQNVGMMDFQVYTILIRLPAESTCSSKYGAERPSIKMYHDDIMAFRLSNAVEGAEVDDEEGIRVLQLADSLMTKQSAALRRPSQIPDIRIPLNAKNIPKTVASKGLLNKAPNKKKKKTQEKKAEKKAAKTLSAILFAFIITWLPYNILVLLKPLTTCVGCIPQELWDFFYYLCYINSTVNPVCYALCNATFRRTYVRILKCKWHSRNRNAGNRGYCP